MDLLSVGLSVRPLVTTVYRGKTAEAIKLPFGVRGRVDPRNGVLGGGPDPLQEGAIFWRREMGRRNVTYRELRENKASALQKRELIELPFGMASGFGRRNRVLDEHAHWRYLAVTVKTTGSATRGDDAASSQITLGNLIHTAIQLNCK